MSAISLAKAQQDRLLGRKLRVVVPVEEEGSPFVGMLRVESAA